MKKLMWLVTGVLSLFLNTNSLAGTTPVKDKKAPNKPAKVVEKPKLKTPPKSAVKPKVAPKPVAKATAKPKLAPKPAAKPKPKIVAKAKPKAKAKLPLPKMSKLEQMIEKLHPAIGKVESHDDDWAIGDKKLLHKAHGRFQIRQPCVDDVNRILGTNYKAEQTRGNYRLSLLIFRTYLKYWGKRLKEPTYEQLAALWNGGPNGPNLECTLAYRAKVRKVL